MSPPAGRTRVGALRPSALMHTFGVGAVVDLPRLSVMVMGLDEWRLDGARIIDEPRLVEAVRPEAGMQRLARLVAPPTPDESSPLSYVTLDGSRLVGVPVAVFPRWLLCPVCRRLAPIESDLWELRTDAFRPDRNRFVHRNCRSAKTPPVALPARFVVACEDGHLDDFPWVAFAHGAASPEEVGCDWALRLDEIGPSGEVAEIQVTCETCNARRRMAQAFGEANRGQMPPCGGASPHLRRRGEPCSRRMRAMLLGASNAWFAVTRSALSLPADGDPVADEVARKWETLQHVSDVAGVALLRSVGALTGFEGVDDEEVWRAIEAQRAGSAAPESPTIRGPEWGLLTAGRPPANDDFEARQVAPPPGFEDLIERVVLLDRLREVQVLLGFSRVEAPHRDDDSEVSWTPLSREPLDWLPAAETHGEGVFVQLREDAVERWRARPDVREREEALFQAHVAWRARRGIDNPAGGFPGMRMVLVHSLAHVLMRRLALECGYSQSAIRERLYAAAPGAPDGPMAGFLLYTATPGSEGTLGGLVSLGEPGPLARHLRGALRDAALCASDPLCADHAPPGDGFALHAAACHACLFAPETSCERGNRYLDRAALVPLVTGASAGFFPVSPT